MTTIKRYPSPHVCTDAAVFTIQTQATENYRKLPKPKLAILLYQRHAEPFQGQWCLPGGFVNIDERPEDNIRRKLADKAQISQGYLEQLFTFCEIDRDPRGRVISIAYLGLLKEADSGVGKWFTVQGSCEQLTFSDGQQTLTQQDFGFDHYAIIQMALQRLGTKIYYSDLVFYLLPEQFTLTQMQNIYEAISGKKETAANFRRKVAHLVQQTAGYTSDKGHRPAKLFTKKETMEDLT